MDLAATQLTESTPLRLPHDYGRANLMIERLRQLDEVDRSRRRIVDALLHAR